MKPNILLLLADQHRASATGFGGNNQVSTPNLDRMASMGASVSTCVSTHPLCAPFRACLQTGQPASVNGVVGNKDSIRRDLITLPQLFKQQGYQTAYFGKCHWHERINDSVYTPPEWRLGWEYWKGWHNGHEDYDLPVFDDDGNRLHTHKGRFAPEVQAEQFLDWHVGKKDEPWIAQMNWGPPHNATLSEEELDDIREESMRINEELGLGLKEHHFQNVWWFVQSFPQYLVRDVVPQRFLDAIDHTQLTVPDNVHPDNHLLIQHHLKEYYAQIAALDELTGQLMAELEARGELENTLVIYTSDHGDWVGSDRDPEDNCRGKGDAHPESVRVPFLAVGPGIADGHDVRMPLATIDLLPTFCGLAGFDCGEGFPGEDVSEVLRGEKAPWLREVTMERPWWKARFDGVRVV